MISRRFFRTSLGLALVLCVGFASTTLLAGLRRPSGWSTNGILVNSTGTAVYGWANLKPAMWLDIQVFHANFAILDGAQRPIGSVAIIPTSTPGVYVWISDQGPTGTIRTSPSEVVWRDASGSTGTYRPL